MKEYFENIDHEIYTSIAKKLINSLSSDDLIKYMDQFSGLFGITHDFYNDVCDMFINGEIKIVNSAWKTNPDPSEYYGYPKKPGFINIDNYKTIKKLQKDKRDWENNWKEYDKKYPVRERFDNKTEFWVGEAYSRNTVMYINNSFLTEIEINKFQFMFEVKKNKEHNYFDDYGQEYVFEFVGEDSHTKFVELFRNKICYDMTDKLIIKRREQMIEDEANKTIEFLNTLIDRK